MFNYVTIDLDLDDETEQWLGKTALANGVSKDHLISDILHWAIKEFKPKKKKNKKKKHKK